FTWNLSAGEALWSLEAASGVAADGRPELSTEIARLRAAERARRDAFPTSLHRAADAYLVRRGAGRTIVAGYPWFTDWGRDTFIALRGLCLAGGRWDDARGILLQWADAVSQGMLPNRFPDSGAEPEFNAVDAALWLNALRIGAAGSARWGALLERGTAAFGARFWNAEGGYLYDVVDVDHQAGTVDAAFRPNQIFAVGGLPFPVLNGPQARQVVDAVAQRLLTPLGLRSLAPGERGYTARYEGGVAARDGAYHQGTVWPWLLGPFVEAWVRVRGGSAAAKRQARDRFLAPLLAHLSEAGLGHISEIADA